MRIAGWIAGAGMVITMAGVEAAFQFSGATPVFDVVSIRRNVPQPGSPPGGSEVQQRPDGGITLINFTVAALIARAYPASFRARRSICPSGLVVSGMTCVPQRH